MPIDATDRTPKRREIDQSIREYGRGIAGGLLFSMPLLYTEELWHTGFLAASTRLIVYIGASFLLLLGYNRFAGMRRDARWWQVAVDSIEEMGIGLVISALVLFLLARIDFDMPLSEIVGKIVIASMTVAVGVSVGTAQLGGASDEDEKCGMEDEAGSDEDRAVSSFDRLGELTLAFCGAVLFASNIGATQEIPHLGMEASSPRLLGLVALSLTIGAIILFFSDFHGSGRAVPRKGFAGLATGLLGSYGAALAASAMMLWFFERLDDKPTIEAVSQIVILAFPSTLGACAGRLLIQAK
ncbi:MAG TPA: TIGR02587 family membrane protein [Pirellulaceae bacterium]|jgi:putative integral membrane protein (TIGR02587 family)|nr:TIGR02587 family membrane protein [Pirellulaceae bacterium]